MELLGADESVIATLTPGDQFVDDDPTQQSTELQLPEDQCVGCAVGDHRWQQWPDIESILVFTSHWTCYYPVIKSSIDFIISDKID